VRERHQENKYERNTSRVREKGNTAGQREIRRQKEREEEYA